MKTLHPIKNLYKNAQKHEILHVNFISPILPRLE